MQQRLDNQLCYRQPEHACYQDITNDADINHFRRPRSNIRGLLLRLGCSRFLTSYGNNSRAMCSSSCRTELSLSLLMPISSLATNNAKPIRTSVSIVIGHSHNVHCGAQRCESLFHGRPALLEYPEGFRMYVPQTSRGQRRFSIMRSWRRGPGRQVQ